MIDQITISKIQDAAQIVEVVSDFVTLRRRGVNYVGLCPFHDDRTPSFYVSPVKNLCKCFSCGVGGSPVHFVMKHEQLSYPEALKFLAKKYNIEVVEKEFTPEEKQAESERESMFIINEYARDYFMKTLHESHEGKAIGLSYFKERGFREDIIKKFQLGYGLDERNAFSVEALRAGFKQEFLIKTGLSGGGENNSPLYDRFRGRVIFPVHTISGKVVAFGGRILKKADKLAKYVNSPESDIYSKSKELYGIFFAKSAIAKAKKCFLVEGYTDVISMHQAGIENVVSSSGTALTQGQINMIRRFSDNITVLYDGDRAGITAALRGIDLLLESGMNVWVVLLPEGEDPDSFARKNNAEGFNKYIEDNEQDFIRFKTQLLLEDTGDDPIKRSGLINNIVESISLIPDSIKRSVYIKDTANIFDTREEVLISSVNRLRRQIFEKRKAEQERNNTQKAISAPTPAAAYTAQLTDNVNIAPKVGATSSPFDHHERELVRYIIRYGMLPIFISFDVENREIDGQRHEVEVVTEDGPTVIEVIREDLTRDDFIFEGKPFFKNELYRTIYEEACNNMFDEAFDPERYFLHHSNPKISHLSVELLGDAYQLSKIHAKAMGEREDDKSSRLNERNSLDRLVIRATTELKNAYVIERVKEVKSKIKTAAPDKIMELMSELKDLQSLKIILAKSLGERIVLRY